VTVPFERLWMEVIPGTHEYRPIVDTRIVVVGIAA
jgi:hypothetical protein